jgi:hypothetical protein
MASVADRAASLAAQITAAIASTVSIDHYTENGAVTLRTRIPDGTDPLAWGRIQLALINLAAQDRFGNLTSSSATATESPTPAASIRRRGSNPAAPGSNARRCVSAAAEGESAVEGDVEGLRGGLQPAHAVRGPGPPPSRASLPSACANWPHRQRP